MTTLRIRTLTTDYDRDEDRMRLSVADAAGQAAVLWLTRRLSDRLIGALLQSLASEAREPVAPVVRQTVQTYAQLQARLMQKPAAPVPYETAAWEGLVREIGLGKDAAGQHCLSFRCGQVPTVAVMPLAALPLRQWLHVLQRIYLRADWRTEIWPEWMKSAVAASPMPGP